MNTGIYDISESDISMDERYDERIYEDIYDNDDIYDRMYGIEKESYEDAYAEMISSIESIGMKKDAGAYHVKKALIMAGGFGTRMKELTDNVPKPMLSLQGRPILEYSIELCKRFGISDIAISIYHFGDMIKEYFGDGTRFGVRIVYVEEKEPLGTGGALRLFKEWFTEPFMMCNADELKDINLQEMYNHHMMSSSLATIALTKVDDPSQYGVVDLQGNQILKFVEKPPRGEEPSNYINAGLYILEPDAIKLIPEGFTMVEKDLFPTLAKNGKLNGYKFEGQWFDTGTPQRYAQTEKNWKGFHELVIKEEV